MTFCTSALIAEDIAPTAFNLSLTSGVLWCFGWAGAAGAGIGAGAAGATGAGGAAAAGIGAGAGAAGAGGIGAAGAGGAAGLFVGTAGGCILHFLLVFLFLLAPTTNHLHEFPQFGFIVVAALALSQLH